MFSLSKRKFSSQWENREQQTTLFVQRLRQNESGQSAAERLHAARARNNFSRLSRAFFFTRIDAHLWCFSQYGFRLAQRKKQLTPELSETLVAPNEPPTLELDELWSFVLKKANKRWIWIALCRQTRQVVAYQIGDRSEATCRKLWERVPAVFRTAHCFSDFWEAYQLVIPPEQHTAVGKESGETAHVERWNNTLRQRLARFVRKTLSFSKSDVMHEICLFLFLHRYNNELALSCD